MTMLYHTKRFHFISWRHTASNDIRRTTFRRRTLYRLRTCCFQNKS